MSNMQNYMTSRSPCGYQNCSDKPSDEWVRHRGRRIDYREALDIIREELSEIDE